ncbi:hypothetical protein IMY05_C4630000200 [Salix suchowensis]|nr:hypothetical protein IMY05_C4630000200 [Salix suchowensis]
MSSLRPEDSRKQRAGHHELFLQPLTTMSSPSLSLSGLRKRRSLLHHSSPSTPSSKATVSSYAMVEVSPVSGREAVESVQSPTNDEQDNESDDASTLDSESSSSETDHREEGVDANGKTNDPAATPNGGKNGNGIGVVNGNGSTKTSPTPKRHVRINSPPRVDTQVPTGVQRAMTRKVPLRRIDGHAPGIPSHLLFTPSSRSPIGWRIHKVRCFFPTISRAILPRSHRALPSPRRLTPAHRRQRHRRTRCTLLVQRNAIRPSHWPPTVAPPGRPHSWRTEEMQGIVCEDSKPWSGVVETEDADEVRQDELYDYVDEAVEAVDRRITDTESRLVRTMHDVDEVGAYIRHWGRSYSATYWISSRSGSRGRWRFRSPVKINPFPAPTGKKSAYNNILIIIREARRTPSARRRTSQQRTMLQRRTRRCMRLRMAQRRLSTPRGSSRFRKKILLPHRLLVPMAYHLPPSLGRLTYHRPPR